LLFSAEPFSLSLRFFNQGFRILPMDAESAVSSDRDDIRNKRNADLARSDPAAALARAARLLRTGGIVAFPTETVYGLGAAVFDEAALARVFEAKNRPRFDPLIVHVSEYESLSQLAADIPESARILMERFWPGPLTLVLPKRERVPDLATAGRPTVAVRMPRHPMALALIRAARTPIAAPSANRFGSVSPTTAQHVRDSLGARADAILDGGPCAVGVESTIVSLIGSDATLLRPGGIATEDIEACIGPLQSGATGAAPGAAMAAPGMLPRHYATRTPLRLVSADQAFLPSADGLRTGLLAFRKPPRIAAYAAVEILSEHGDSNEAAARLFGAMRRLDAAGLDRILAEPAPDIGLGRAINDRLRRAAHDEDEANHHDEAEVCYGSRDH
jgi:L-threonylcarbamoyladenylate synthase